MTRDTQRPAESADADLLAGLWEEAPFARLPWDAPAELKELVEDIDNPKRVYAVYRASRRHNFQQLVQKFIIQLRDGCGDSSCCTPTCFTCRKRISGRAPIRRYNTTSARTLAVYLASQDNAESGLCPTLNAPKAPPAAMSSLMFTPRRNHQPRDDGRIPAFKAQNGHVRGGPPPKERANGARNLSASSSPAREGPQGSADRQSSSSPTQQPLQPEQRQDSTETTTTPKFSVAEKSVSKDYRSFAANMFGTVAFKMLEWLTPLAVEDMSSRARQLQGEPVANGKAASPKPAGISSKYSSQPTSPRSRSPTEPIVNGAAVASTGATDTNDPAPAPAAEPETAEPLVRHDSKEKDTTPRRIPSTSRPNHPRHNSNARVRAPNTTKPKRKLSIDTFPQDAATDDLIPGLRSPRLPAIQGDKNPRALKSSNSTIPRPISQLTNAGYFDGVSLEKMPPPAVSSDIRSRITRVQTDGPQSSGSESPRRPGSSSASHCSDGAPPAAQSAPVFDPDLESTYDALLPQTLTRLSADVVDFVCDVLQEDGTAEQHLLEPSIVTKFHTRFATQPRPMRRKQKARRGALPGPLRLEWKLFVEQSLFYVLSDAQRVVRSFTKKGQLYDSQTLWYCMLRLTRVAPSLVFHCLWMAAEVLFAPPRAVQSLRSPTARLFPKQGKSLSNTEAGLLMSICLHALVAAAPLVGDTRQLYDMSRIRSHGLSLAGSGAVARQPSSLCLQYDDAFSNDLAMRLARRLFAAITTRRYFDDMVEHDSKSDADLDERVSSTSEASGGGDSEPDILSPLFAQLDFLNMDAVYILNFSFSDRALHETRVPTLLLDWARAVMLNDWDGRPEVPRDGPFGGALALIAAMYDERQALLLGDTQFRSEYFAERLDEVEMPVSWLSFTSTRQKVHLLDFPYIFNPSTLVSYFRSINFSRMSRAFEESSSLEGRMKAIMLPGSLIADVHHKEVLQKLLRTASSKYLILAIGRQNVIHHAFNQLWRREERELMRPLKVHLGEDHGEEGFDSGGVQQEFFRLAMAEALDPDYGAFTVDERTRMVWFLPGTLEPDWKFELMGLLVSLAVYNGLTLPVTFPKALYRKLLGKPVTELHHIADGWPDLASGLTTLLEWDEKDGAVEDVFARTYEFSVETFRQPVSREMTADGTWPQHYHPLSGEGPSSSSSSSSPPPPPPPPQLPPHLDNPPDAPLVTHENRNAYVSDYIRYLTDVSVRPQYEAFERGFRRCLHPKSLTLLTSALLQSVVEGTQDIDVGELRRYARYVGWDASHRTVRDFWNIVKRYDDDMKRKLLEFVTASDRVPVGGMKNLQFVVQRNGEEEGEGGHLPTAYTCYGTLLLPEYRDKEVLRERLAMALENSQGFGFA